MDPVWIILKIVIAFRSIMKFKLFWDANKNNRLCIFGYIHSWQNIQLKTILSIPTEFSKSIQICQKQKLIKWFIETCECLFNEFSFSVQLLQNKLHCICLGDCKIVIIEYSYTIISLSKKNRRFTFTKCLLFVVNISNDRM